MRLRAQRFTAASIAAVVLASGLSACETAADSDSDRPAGDSGSGAGAVEPEKPAPVRLTTSFGDPTAVPIDAPVMVSTSGAELTGAQWLYDRTSRGDVVEVTGSNRSMTLENGYGDWNLSPADWKSGSALS